VIIVFSLPLFLRFLLFHQVIRRGDRRPFYAPAKYVAELRPSDHESGHQQQQQRRELKSRVGTGGGGGIPWPYNANKNRPGKYSISKFL